jgi:hypothetical protein
MRQIFKPLIAFVICTNLMMTVAKAEAPYPTAERYLFVRQCMNEHADFLSPPMYQCACVMDKLVATVPYEEFSFLRAVGMAVTIGGERGGELRDNQAVQDSARKYRDLMKKLAQSCDLQP